MAKRYWILFVLCIIACVGLLFSGDKFFIGMGGSMLLLTILQFPSGVKLEQLEERTVYPKPVSKSDDLEPPMERLTSKVKEPVIEDHEQHYHQIPGIIPPGEQYPRGHRADNK